jgi:hypothetical protein
VIMKKFFLPAMGVFLLLIAACQTKPKPTPSPAPTPSPTSAPSPTPEPTKAPVDMSADDAKAESLRAKCVDYGINESQSDAYAEANAKLDEARKAAAAGDSVKAASLYAEAIAAFEKVLGEGLGTLASDYRARADKMREAAESEGADDSCPDQMDGAFANYQAGDASKDANALEDAVASYKLALSRWEIAYERAKTVKVWDEINAYNLQDADKGNYEIASAKFEESDAVFPDDVVASLDAMQIAELRFNIVYDTAWALGMTQARESVEAERERAQEAKADYAVPDLFDEAGALAEEAQALEDAERFAEAEETYARAVEAYAVATEEAIVKRDETTDVLEKLRRKKEASRDAAKEGDALLQGSQGEGAAR